jgi:hypothetical protein
VAKKYQEKIEENRRSQKERRTNPKNLKEKLEKPVKTERGISGLRLPFTFTFLFYFFGLSGLSGLSGLFGLSGLSVSFCPF